MDSWGDGSSCYPESWNWEHLSVDRCYAELRKRLSEEWALSEPGSLVDRYCVKNDLVSKSHGVQTTWCPNWPGVRTDLCSNNLVSRQLKNFVPYWLGYLMSKPLGVQITVSKLIWCPAISFQIPVWGKGGGGLGPVSTPWGWGPPMI